MQQKDDIELFDLLVPLLRHIKAGLLIGIFFAAFGVYYAMKLPVEYRAEARIYPVGSGKSAGGVAGMMMGDLGLGGLVSGMMSTDSDRFLAFLGSENMAERVLNRLQNELLEILYPTIWDDKAQKWMVEGEQVPFRSDIVRSVKGMMKFQEAQKKVFIELYAVSTDPVFTVKLINAYLEEFAMFLAENDLTIAQRNNKFVKKQLLKNQKIYLEESRNLGQFHDYYKVMSQNPSVEVDLGSVFEDDVVTLVRPLSGLGVTGDGSNGGVTDPIEGVTNHNQSPGDDLWAVQNQVVKNIPADVYLEYVTARKNVLAMVTGLLEKQYQFGKIEAEKEKLEFSIIDAPKVPRHRYKPNRRLVLMVFVALGFFVTCVYAYGFEFLKKNLSGWREKLKMS